MSVIMKEWQTDNCLVEIMQHLFRSYGDDFTERRVLVGKLRQLADHLEAGGPRPTNVLLGDPTGYKVP